MTPVITTNMLVFPDDMKAVPCADASHTVLAPQGLGEMAELMSQDGSSPVVHITLTYHDDAETSVTMSALNW